MEMEWSKFINHHFVDEDVWVTVPPQESEHELLLESPELNGDDMPETPTVFTPSDIRINFQVREREEGDGSGSLVQKFSPPMVLRVGITDLAKQAAQSKNRRLQLAFWDGSEWVPFTREKHLFRLTPKYGIAVIRDWGDPPVAWG
jgi:hypothetical protein